MRVRPHAQRQAERPGAGAFVGVGLHLPPGDIRTLRGGIGKGCTHPQRTVKVIRKIAHASALSCHENSSPPRLRRGVGGGGVRDKSSRSTTPWPPPCQGGESPGAFSSFVASRRLMISTHCPTEFVPCPPLSCAGDALEPSSAREPLLIDEPALASALPWPHPCRRTSPIYPSAELGSFLSFFRPARKPWKGLPWVAIIPVDY